MIGLFNLNVLTVISKKLSLLLSLLDIYILPCKLILLDFKYKSDNWFKIILDSNSKSPTYKFFNLILIKWLYFYFWFFSHLYNFLKNSKISFLLQNVL